MRSFVVAVSLLLLSFSAANAVTPSKASLKGTYFFQVTQVEVVSWGKTVSATCFGTKYSFFVSGQAVANKVNFGTVAFNGTGTYSMSTSEAGELNQTASNNTVSITCTSNRSQPYTTNSGSPVFEAPSPTTMSGSYTVASDQTGTMTLSDPDGEQIIDLSLGDLNASGVAGVVLISQPGKKDGNYTTGIAILK
jgi:hypothetical protein